MDATPAPVLFRDPFAPLGTCGVVSKTWSTCTRTDGHQGQHAGPIPDLGIDTPIPFDDGDAITR